MKYLLSCLLLSSASSTFAAYVRVINNSEQTVNSLRLMDKDILKINKGKNITTAVVMLVNGKVVTRVGENLVQDLLPGDSVTFRFKDNQDAYLFYPGSALTITNPFIRVGLGEDSAHYILPNGTYETIVTITGWNKGNNPTDDYFYGTCEDQLHQACGTFEYPLD